CPPLLNPDALLVLRRANTIVLTVRAEPLSIRTVPAAAGALATARVGNSRLELLGVLLGIYNDQDPLQPPMLERLRQMHGALPPLPRPARLRCSWTPTRSAASPRP